MEQTDFSACFSEDVNYADQLHFLQQFQAEIYSTSPDCIIEMMTEASVHFTKKSLQSCVRKEILHTIMVCCNVLSSESERLLPSYLSPLLSWLGDQTEEDVRAQAGECARLMLSQVEGPTFDGSLQREIMDFVERRLQEFSGETVLLVCFLCIRALSLHPCTFRSSSFWQNVIDKLYRIKESNHLPESTLLEASRCYSQLLMHLQAQEVASPVRLTVRESLIESPCSGRIMGTITNTFEAWRASAMKGKAGEELRLARGASEPSLFSPARPRHRIAFELFVSPHRPTPAGLPPLEFRGFSFPQLSCPLPDAPLPTPAWLPLQARPAPLFALADPPTRPASPPSRAAIAHAPASPEAAASAEVSSPSQAPLISSLDATPKSLGSPKPAAAQTPPPPSPEHDDPPAAPCARSPSPEVLTPCAIRPDTSARHGKRPRVQSPGDTDCLQNLSPESQVSADLVQDNDSCILLGEKLNFESVAAEDEFDIQEREDPRCLSADPACPTLPPSLVADEFDIQEREDPRCLSADPACPTLPPSLVAGSPEPRSPARDICAASPKAENAVAAATSRSAPSPSATETGRPQPQSSPPLGGSPPVPPTAPGPPPFRMALDTPSPVPLSLGSRAISKSPCFRAMSPSSDLLSLPAVNENSRLELDVEYRALHEQYVTLEEQYNKLTTRHEELQGEYEKVTKLNENRKKTILNLSRNEDWYMTRVQELEDEAGEFQRRYDHLYHTASEKLSIAEKEIQKRQAGVEQAQKEIKILNSELEVSSAELNHLKSQHDLLSQQFNSSTKELSRCQAMLQAEQLEKDRLTALVEERSQALQAAMEQLTASEKAVEEIKAKAENRIKTLTAQIAYTKAKLEEREAENRALEQAGPAQRSELETNQYAVKMRLAKIIVTAGGRPLREDQSLQAYAEQIAELMKKKEQETAELLGYCDRLLAQSERK